MRNSLFIIGLFIFVSCEDKVTIMSNNTDYILFGHFAGFCVGEQCIQIYKLTDTDLFEDTMDQYPNSQAPYDGDYTRLSDERFQMVKSLVNQVPEQLLTSQDTIIGSPDAADGGGVYFAINNGAETRFWLIDQVESNLPEYLIPFKKSINAAVEQLTQ